MNILTAIALALFLALVIVIGYHWRATAQELPAGAPYKMRLAELYKRLGSRLTA